MTDVELLFSLTRAAVAGDPAALDGLLRELEPYVVRTTRLIVGAESWVAEDAAQEALLDISRNIGALREPRAVVTWALRIATVRAQKVSRRERIASFGRHPRQAPELAVDVATDRRILKECFDALPSRMRITAVLRIHVGLSESETASVMGCSVGTVKSNLHQARERLSETLRRHGITPSTVAPKEAVDEPSTSR